MNRRKRRGFGAAGWLLALAISIAAGGTSAQDYPTRPIRLIVPTSPGGLMDVAANLTADYLSRALGQRMLIENRGGAAGNLGVDAIAKATPDGYTLGLIQLGNVAINPYMFKDLPYDALNDLEPIAAVTSSAILVFATAKLPANNLRELIALAKREPGRLNYGTAGPGTVPHLAGALFAQLAGVDIVPIPYRGAGPAVVDLAAGQVQLSFVGLGAVKGPLKSGTVKALAVAQGARLKAAPEIPTADEAGLAGYEFTTWFGLVAPRGTPGRIVTMLSGLVRKMQDDPAVEARLSDGGLEPLREGPEEFRARIRRDHGRFRDIVKSAGLAPE